MPQQRRDILGVVPPIQHPLPGAGQAQQAAPDVELFGKEALHVVRLHAESISTPAAGNMSRDTRGDLGVREWLSCHLIGPFPGRIGVSKRTHTISVLSPL